MLAPVVVAFALTVAPAAPPTLAGGAPAPSTDAWYGGPAVVSDLASGGALALAYGLAATNHNWPAAGALTLGLVGLGFGAPVNHVMNGHLGRAWGSFAMRLGGFVTGVIAAGITAAATHCNPIGTEEHPNGTCTDAALGVAFVIPILASFALDDALLARGPARDRAPTRSTRAGRDLLGQSLVSAGVIVSLGSVILLSVESKQVTDTNNTLAHGPNPSAQYNLDKAYLGVGIGVGLLAAGVAGIAGGIYLVRTTPHEPLTASLGPWTDGFGARGLGFSTRF